jgi:hypothetical protein
MRTMVEAKQGRWVYEGGELEQDSKSPKSYYGVFKHLLFMVLGGPYKA